MTTAVTGALLAGYLTVMLFFLRFWRDSHDRLFALFAAAFGLLAVQRVALILTMESLEDQTIFYVLRLLAFVLIIVAIIDKNRRPV
jgi:hypothetical protein